MSLPGLMVHTFKHYTVTYTADASAGYVPAFTLANDNCPCNFQYDVSSVNKEHDKDDEQRKASIYLINSTVFAAVNIQDILKVSSVNYRVTGKKNACGLSRVYRINVEEDLSNRTV